jgi:type I restriction enzyme R subunit
MLNEPHLEKQALLWFASVGYMQINHQERDDCHQVVLLPRLQASLQRINPSLPNVALELAIETLTKISEVNLIKRNRIFHHYLVNGVAVNYKQDGEDKHETVFIVDFNQVANNDWCIINQFTVIGSKLQFRPDIVVFLNGLPISVIELKNPADDNTDIWDAYSQLETYKSQISELFSYNEALIISDGLMARVGSLTANAERFMPWRIVDDYNNRANFALELETLVKGFFKPELFLDYLRYFVFFEDDNGTLIKKIAAYHQFHAVRDAIIAVVSATATGSGQGGVVWHTQGSGKSISMCCLAAKLLSSPELNLPTIIIVTDRNDLDGQLLEQFSRVQELLGSEPRSIENRADLREVLKKQNAGGIIFTTIQKFALLDNEDKHPELSLRKNIVVIADEAHRSQYGFKTRLNKTSGIYQQGYAKSMREALPHATFIGFTGTPVEETDKDTRKVFGDYISVYDIQDAVADGATVPIYYESRLAKLGLDDAKLAELNQEIEEVLEDEEFSAKEREKSKWAALEKLVGSQPRIDLVASDLLEHFSAQSGKAMLVCMSRDICVRMYAALNKLRPDWFSDDVDSGAVKIIMTGNSSDKPEFQKHIYSKAQRRRLEKRFKDPNDTLQLVIVRDMWLTGFDAPCCQTMYVDKPMRGHNLMQAIARVNRVFKDKPGGLVVDYIGIATDLKYAFKTYIDASGKGELTLDNTRVVNLLLTDINAMRDFLNGFDYSSYTTHPLQLLAPMVNFILDLVDGKKRYLDLMSRINSNYSLCQGRDEVSIYARELAFWLAVQSAIIKYTSVNHKIERVFNNSIIRGILDNAIATDGIADIFTLAGVNKPNISLISDEFLDEVRHLKLKNLAVELLNKLIKDEVKAKLHNNVVLEKQFSDRLISTMNKYHNRSLEAAEIMNELFMLVKDVKAKLEQNDKLGLNPDEVAFYYALADNKEALQVLGDGTLKQIAVELTNGLRAKATIDWREKESVRASMRLMIRRLLRKYKYPPDKHEQAIEIVIKQAETLCDEWV